MNILILIGAWYLICEVIALLICRACRIDPNDHDSPEVKAIRVGVMIAPIVLAMIGLAVITMKVHQLAYRISFFPKPSDDPLDYL